MHLNLIFKIILIPAFHDLSCLFHYDISILNIILFHSVFKAMPPQDDPPLHNYCTDYWTWNKRDKSHEVRILGENFQTAFFHPNWSNGTAAVRGTRILNRGRYYWEINVTRRIFGTSMMFGKFVYSKHLYFS